MITQLSIQGLAIIDSLSIDFSSGFNVITGETGAGKSILIRALNFLMGAKYGADAVRNGCEQATVLGEFQVRPGHPALSVLSGLGIPTEEAAGAFTILIRRTLTSKGRSQSWVNDIGVTSQPLRSLGATLVDIFGQHENQRLMDSGQHTYYLDHFLPGDKVKSLVRVEALGRECQELIGELSKTLEIFRNGERSRDYLSFRWDELQKFGPVTEDFEKVEAFCRLADRRGQVKETLVKALHHVEGNGEERGVSQGIWEASKLLGQLAGQNEEEETALWAGLKERAVALAGELEDLSFELGRHVSKFDFDESELEEAQARLFGYQDLFRKHSVRETCELVAETERLRQEIAFLESASVNIEAMVGRLSEQAGLLEEAAKDLSRARKAAGLSVKKRVEAELHELAMPGSLLEVEFSPIRRALPELDLSAFGENVVTEWKRVQDRLAGVGERGGEKSQFLLASNPGEPLLPLSRIASGGELSRIMLALKKSLAVDADTCVLVFDEIDTGISGRVADVVGRKMRDLASAFQVICISHLPQVAVYADAHFLVQKGERGKRTESSIVRLSRDESAREIARLLSGAEVSPPSLANARNLMARARGEKKIGLRKLPAALDLLPK